MPDGYNGYTNYQTWVVALWIDNDEYSQDRALEITESAQGDRSALAESLNEWICEEYLPDLGSSLAADLFGSALGLVDWYDLAETYESVLAEQTKRRHNV